MQTDRGYVLWISRGRLPTPPELALLKYHYRGAEVIVKMCGTAHEILNEVEKRLHVDWVLVSAEAVVWDVVREIRGLNLTHVQFPLRPAVRLSTDGRNDFEIDGCRHVFYGFERVLRCEYIEEDPTPQVDIRRVLIPDSTRSLDCRLLNVIFPQGKLIRSDKLQYRRSGEECLDLVLTSGAQGCLLTCHHPPKVFERVVAGGVYTVYANTMQHLRRVIAPRRDTRLVLPYRRP